MKLEMPRPKSAVKNIEITIAGASHNCKNNKRHRIEKGDSRLTIKEGRASKNYCLECAKYFIAKDIDKLMEVLSRLG